MHKNKCCNHCEYQNVQDIAHEFMNEVCQLELGTIYRCDVCGASWMKSVNRGWLLLRQGQTGLKLVG